MNTANRIAIAGGSGAGKTTLARELARRIDGVFVEVDAIQHKADWIKATVGDVSIGIHAALDGQARWVIDSICEGEVGDFISSVADIIVWLDLPLAVKLRRLLQRSWRRVRGRELLWNGNVETWRDVFVGRDAVLVRPLLTHLRQRWRMLARHDHEKIVRLCSASEVNAWLATFPASRVSVQTTTDKAG